MEENLSNSGVSPYALLQFYADIGIDDVVGDEALDRTKIPETVLPMVSAAAGAASGTATAPTADEPVAGASMGAVEALAEAKTLAAAAQTLEELREAIANFKGLAIKRTATQMVFASGNPAARIMLVGDVPGADEDRLGKPFAGIEGQLLDKMLAAIGLNRDEHIYISNVMNWRPPGNRAPDAAEIAISLPFIERHIELVNPAVVIFMGGAAAQALLHSKQSITRLRGRWQTYKTAQMEQPVQALCMLHPGYLLNSPQQKGLAWSDLLQLKEKLASLGIVRA
jgi:uracil-DNA glycosylase